MRVFSRTILLAGVFGAALCASANAQDYRYAQPGYSSDSEEVIVRAPHYRPERSTIGAPIETVALQRGVRFDDLDLASDWGVRTLRERVGYTARQLCRQLDNEYPVTVSDGTGSCYRRAYEQAMGDADDVIARARDAAYDRPGRYRRTEETRYEDRRPYNDGDNDNDGY